MKVVVVMVMLIVLALAGQGWAQGNCTESCYSGTFCCMDTCCDNGTESCCPDKAHGSICCIAESTYCCPPVADYASHCCPRWNICCYGGRYGCCDPTTGKHTEDNFAYALFVLQKDFAALQIDLNTGSYTQLPVKGYDDWEEVTRVFTYDAVHNLFYLLQTNFIEHPQAPQHNITLYVVDPTTGSTTAKTVQGCTEPGEVDVPGFAYNANTNQIIMSTYVLGQNTVGYNFYTLDPESAVATLQSQYSSENDSFVGWFDVVSVDSKTVYRVGYQDVVNSQITGVGVTDISSKTATTQWIADIPLPPKYQFYLSLNLYGENMLSLAPDDVGNLNLVKWQIGGSAEVVASFSNAHNTPVFGPIVEYVTQNQTLYAALIVKNDVASTLDRWAIALADLDSEGKLIGEVREIDLSPILLAKLDPASSFGIPA